MQKYEKKILIIMSLCFLIISGIILNGKLNLTEDEVFSYGSANHQGYPLMQIEDGVTYEKGFTPFEDYIYVQSDSRFQYRNVWKNQSIDIHPPVYYVILHTICSIFPGTFSMWYAGVINMIFAVAIIWILYAILKEFEVDKNAAFVICAAYVLTAGIYQACTFFRMYIVAMFFCTLLCWLHIRWYRHQYIGKECLMIYAISVAGVLTHYFVIVFVVVEAILFGIILLAEKKYRTIIKYAAAMCAAAVSSLVLYPAMLEHIFGRYRGKEAVQNAKNIEDAWERYRAFGLSLSRDVWGGCAWLIAAAAVVAIVMHLRKRMFDDRRIKMWLILCVPAGIYFFVISKIASYISNRYMFPVYAILFLTGYLLLWNVVRMLRLSSWKRYALFGILAAMILWNGFRVCQWRFSYQDALSKQALNVAEQCKDRACLYIYRKEDVWAVQSSYFEIRQYRNVTFFEEQNLDELAAKRNHEEEEGMVVYVEKRCDEDSALIAIREAYPEYSNIQKVAESTYTNTYTVE